MSFRLAQELAAQGTPVAVACRMLEVSTSGYYEWRGREPSPRAVANAVLTEQIIEIHAMSRESYGAPGCTRSFASDGGSAAAASAWHD